MEETEEEKEGQEEAVNESTEKMVVELYKNGVSWNDIMEQTGLSVTAINKILKTHGLSRRRSTIRQILIRLTEPEMKKLDAIIDYLIAYGYIQDKNYSLEDKVRYVIVAFHEYLKRVVMHERGEE